MTDRKGVTQADRLAAWPHRYQGAYGEDSKEAWLSGRYDGSEIIQAFARHRLAEQSRLASAGCDFDAILRAFADKHGPSGGAWNISMLLEAFHAAPPPPGTTEAVVTDEGIKRAAIVLLRIEYPEVLWSDLDDSDKDAYRDQARACLEAALRVG